MYSEETAHQEYFGGTTMKKTKKDEIEMKVFELLDLFMRDSSLGVFQSRLTFIRQLLSYLQSKDP
jgi:hypothetical protein